MGYTTDFYGSLKLNKELTPEQKNYINTFSNTRRMKRDVNILMELYKGKWGYPGIPENSNPALIYGNDGEYFVYDDGNCGQLHDKSIIEYNIPPGQTNFMRLDKIGQPGLWCQWVIEEDIKDLGNQYLQWDGNEKFYNYIEWLEYLIKHFFEKWDVLLNGEIIWEGEDSSDLGKIIVKNNVVTVKEGKVIYRSCLSSKNNSKINRILFIIYKNFCCICNRF